MKLPKLSLKNSSFFLPMAPHGWKIKMLVFAEKYDQGGTHGKNEYFFSKIEKLMMQFLFSDYFEPTLKILSKNSIIVAGLIPVKVNMLC